MLKQKHGHGDSIVGMTFLPNGNGGLMMIPTADTPPDRYNGRYLTSSDVYVDVTYHTSNKAIADELEAQIVKGMNWRLVPEGQAPASIWSDLGTIWGIALLAAFLIPCVAFIGAIGWQAAGWGDFNSIDNALKYSIRGVVYLVPSLALLFSCVALFQHSSRK
jgi:hypothetical protein